ncbi:hypothetical protein MJU95_016495 [Clostridioides difficile]|nr:hypothetical protein [Clostridioides difficile]
MEGNVVNLINDIIKSGQVILVAVAAFCYLVGAYNQISGGKDGFQVAKSWYKNTTFGLVVGMSVMQLVSFLQSKINF